MVPGLSVMPLHEFNGVGTALVKWAPNTIFNPHVHPGGEEIFVIKGVFMMSMQVIQQAVGSEVQDIVSTPLLQNQKVR
jgi:hypothetical protein